MSSVEKSFELELAEVFTWDTDAEKEVALRILKRTANIIGADRLIERSAKLEKIFLLDKKEKK